MAVGVIESIRGIFIIEGDVMKIRAISMTNRFSISKKVKKGVLNTDINVKRVPSHKEQLDTFVKLYGEKEMKRFGIIECATCASRVYKGPLESNANREASGDIFICPECGRSYDDKGIVNITCLKDKDYESKSELFEGLKLDERI